MNKYPNIIKLPNRYRENVYLKLIENNIYELVLPEPYCRMGIKEDNPHEYTFVDPSGGPFIAEGGEFYDYITKDVYKCNKIYWDKPDNVEFESIIFEIEHIEQN